VKIDQIDLLVSEVETWRFCNKCSHMELNDSESNKKCCPRCESALWPDEGQKKHLIRLKSVVATTGDKNSRLDDKSEERSHTSFLRKMHVGFDPKNVVKAFSIKADGKTFAFEFIRSANFCDVNFGEPGLDSHAVEIAGERKGRKGFPICSKCGKVQTAGKEPRHTYTCPAKGRENEKTFCSPVWLYREFNSECIRLLIPPYYGQNLQSGEPSFVAALHLGLKKLFGGSINHLQTTYQEVPIKDGLSAKHLVLYDTIPGGTGYLKELTRSPDEMLKVLEGALEVLKSCPCNQEPGKDGCYRCLFAYRFSKELDGLSRELAKEMLADIIRNKDKLEEISHMGTIDLEERLDSELEVKFLEAVDRYRQAGVHVAVKKELVGGKSGRLIDIGLNKWRLEPDVYIRLPNQPARHIQADFLLTPVKIDKLQNLKPIAIFTDGFKYHKAIISEDMWKRKALVDSQKYLVWSLTWHDVVATAKEVDPAQCLNILDPDGKPKANQYPQWIKNKLPDFEGFHRLNSFELLFRYLQHPSIDQWKDFAKYHAGLFVDNDPNKLELLKQTIPEWHITNFQCKTAFGVYEYQDRNQKTALSLFSSFLDKDQSFSVLCFLQDAIEDQPFDDFRPVWNGYLRLYNVFQFLPESKFITQKGITQDLYPQPVKENHEVPDEKWQSVINETLDDDAKSFLHYLANQGTQIPIIGFELMVNEEVSGMAEMAWPDKKIAFISNDHEEMKSVFIKHQWSCLSGEQIRNRPHEAAAIIIS